MGQGIFRRVSAAAMVALAMTSSAFGAGTRTEIDMDAIRDSVAAVAAAETTEDERARLADLRQVLAHSGTIFSVHLRQSDGTEVNLATGTGPEPEAPVVISATLNGDSWSSDPFAPVDLSNFYLLFRE